MIHDNNYNDDEVQSDEFSDFDEPYHETASDWLRRSARRRARRLAGVSSCSSSSSSDESIEEGGDGEMTTSNNNNTNNNAAFKPMTKWQRQYPIAAARACLSLSSHLDDAKNGHSRECSRLHRIFRKLHRRQSQQKNHDDNTQSIENDKLVIDSFIPRGTGISIIDSALAKETRRRGNSSGSLVFEMTGNRRSGKTTTLVAIAARYVASTTNSFFRDLLVEREANKSAGADEEDELNPSKRQRRHGNNSQSTQSVIEPRIVILDIDYCVNPIKLMLAVREAVLRRFHETSVARKWIRELKATKNAQGDVVTGTSTRMEEDSETHLYDELSAREKKMIERTIASCLGRINIVQPRDFTYLSLVATLEGLRQSLDNERNHNKQKQAPTLIMIDSMSTLDASTQFQESLPAKGSHSGLSDRNEFYRQLIRLRDSHEVAIIGTSVTTAGRCSIWDKIVTHRVLI